MKKRPNLMILDEPTNHMDIIGKETLEDMLMNYSGTVLFVSHDSISSGSWLHPCWYFLRRE
jgi:ATP-binding cassette subfamily F protein 3